ncbi:ribonuclease J [Planctobacterium marinum]
MNLNLYGHDGAWLMVDCGITFDAKIDDQQAHKFDIVAADPSFISKRKEQLCGIVISHAHEDHIGALARLWRRFKADVYTTPFTAEILRRKFQREGEKRPPVIHEVTEYEIHHIGPFEVQWHPMNHSLPEPFGLSLKTQAGSVFHSADWKLDNKPVLGKPLNPNALKRLTRYNFLATVCDSTNALKPGYSLSEHDCYEGLKAHIAQAQGRVAVACFSTNIARLISLARIANETGRYFALLGRALENTVAVARLTGHWPEDLTIQDPNTVGYLPPDEVLVAVTGSQGEERAVLNRMADGYYRQIDLDKGDTVIFSSVIIPDNELKIERLVNKLKAHNIAVVQAETSNIPVHASGHPNEEELRHFYKALQPQIAIPTHGEAAHMERNAQIAKECHVPTQLTGFNGDLFKIAPEAQVIKGFAPVGRIPLAE